MLNIANQNQISTTPYLPDAPKVGILCFPKSLTHIDIYGKGLDTLKSPKKSGVEKLTCQILNYIELQ